MANGFKYDAFISYRHAELDKFVAENLHKKLESYKVSKKVVSNGRARRSRIERVFRDKDELPITNNLEDPIVQALQQSEYLLVICTPRLKESVWCKKEIETFINMHGRDKIFAVLAEGEPHESFPEEILYREGQVQYPDGTIGMGLIPVEPLAADVRGKSKKEILKAMDVEVLRLLAPMLGVDFDDLKQRHRERKFRKIITATLAAAVLCLGIGIASTITALHINKQKDKIEAQSIEIQAQADEIASQSDAIQAQNDMLLENQAKQLAEESLDLLQVGDRKGAVEKATLSLTSYDGIDMPYTPEAQFALTKALRVYDCGVTNKPYMQFEMSGVIQEHTTSGDGKYVAALDTVGQLCVWNVENGEEVYSTYTISETGGQGCRYCFINNSTLLYTMTDGSVNVYDLENSQLLNSQIVENVFLVRASSSGKYYAIGSYDFINIYESETYTLVKTFESDGIGGDGDCHFTDNDIFVYTEKAEESIDESEMKTEELEESSVKLGTAIHMYDLNDGISLEDVQITYSTTYGITSDGDNIYILGATYNLVYDNPLEGDGVSGIIKYDCKAQEMLWESTFNDVLLTDFVLSGVDGGHVMVYSDTVGYFVNDATGGVTSFYVMGSAIVGCAIYTDADAYALFDEDGVFYYISPEDAMPMGMTDMFEKNNYSAAWFEVVSGGFIVHPYDHNKLVLYKTLINEDMVSCEEDVLYDVSVNRDENPYDTARELGLEKAALVIDIIYNSDESLMFISYMDGTLDVYNNQDKTLIKTISGLRDSMVRSYGEDGTGNIYLSGYIYGYVLDKDYNLIAEIERMRNVDFENNRVIVEGDNGFFGIPIYSVEELIELGKADLED